MNLSSYLVAYEIEEVGEGFVQIMTALAKQGRAATGVVGDGTFCPVGLLMDENERELVEDTAVGLKKIARLLKIRGSIDRDVANLLEYLRYTHFSIGTVGNQFRQDLIAYVSLHRAVFSDSCVDDPYIDAAIEAIRAEIE